MDESQYYGVLRKGLGIPVCSKDYTLSTPVTIFNCRSIGNSKSFIKRQRIFIKAGVRLLQHHHLPILCSSWSQNDFSRFFLPATNCRMGESLPRHQHPLFKWLLGDRDFGRPCEDKGLEHSWSTNRQFFYREWYHHQVISGAHYSFHTFFLASAIHVGYPLVWNILRLPSPQRDVLPPVVEGVQAKQGNRPFFSKIP